MPVTVAVLFPFRYDRASCDIAAKNATLATMMHAAYARLAAQQASPASPPWMHHDGSRHEKSVSDWPFKNLFE